MRKAYRAFSKAVEAGEKDTVKKILDNPGTPFTVNDSDRFGRTALMSSSNKGHIGIVRMLLEYKADVTLFDNQNRTAVMDAAMGGQPEIILLLVREFGADVTRRNKYGATAVHYGAHQGHVQTVKVLVEQCGADVNARDNDGDTALILASRWNRPEATRCLLEKGADLNIRGRGNRTALEWAVARGCHVCAGIIIEFETKRLGRVLSRDCGEINMLHPQILDATIGTIRSSGQKDAVKRIGSAVVPSSSSSSSSIVPPTDSNENQQRKRTGGLLNNDDDVAAGSKRARSSDP
mmetsp:Transcript_28306/g.46038  ORF Transcript_28306/g.46038 Transcript_28306/m.46038 type:complete len:292 (+) Transcript_28306:90-965(+)